MTTGSSPRSPPPFNSNTNRDTEERLAARRAARLRFHRPDSGPVLDYLGIRFDRRHARFRNLGDYVVSNNRLISKHACIDAFIARRRLR